MTARTVLHTSWVSWARQALTLMAAALALMLSAVETLVTDPAACLALAPAGCCTFFVATKAGLSFHHLARSTRAFMTAFLASVLEAAEQLATHVFAGELGSSR